MSIEEEDGGLLGIQEEASERDDEQNFDNFDEGPDAGDMAGHGEMTARSDKHSATVVHTESFEELELLPEVREDVLGAWALFLQAAESRDMAGETLLAAVFEAAPSIQSLFRTATAVMALRFMNGLSMVLNSLGDPKALKTIVETLGFQHMDTEVTVAHVAVFRDCIAESLQSELGPRFSPRAQKGWCTILNYVGGSFIYLRVNCAERLRILVSSWATANNRRHDAGAADQEAEGSGLEGRSGSAASGTVSMEKGALGGSAKKGAGGSGAKAARPSSWWGAGQSKGSGSAEKEMESASREGMSTMGSIANGSVPTTYSEMFRFNAAVMGFGSKVWMTEVLSSFDTIVTNASNTYRLQEECDVLSLRLAKYPAAGIVLGEYKAIMLASLRSLVPKDWNSAHEVAWSWLWDNVAHLLKTMMGLPTEMEQALASLWGQLEEEQLNLMRRDLYNNFFTLAPAGQEFFKQSTTRLHYISDLVRSLTVEIYRDPDKVVEDISGIGLRHVGYGIPVDLIAPFLTSWLQVVRKVTDNSAAEQSFRWSLSLIARIMKRVITEGSTIVMKAINANSGKLLQKAVSYAPRGKRAAWMLNVQVGTQRISPFMWALESGSLEAANAIIVDLLTIRADRDRYYFAVDALFERHPDVIQRLTVDAPSLLPTLLDGLIWRARTTEKGMRRVNYYIKHLVVTADGEFSKCIEWLMDGDDPKIACHPVVSLVMDLIWSSAAYGAFLTGKAWLLFCVALFVIAQSFLNRWEDIYAHPGQGGLHVLVDHNPLWMRITIFGLRVFLYTASMGRWAQYHATHIYKDYRSGDVAVWWGSIKVPTYLGTWQNRVSLMLALSLIAMFIQCPVLYCLGKTPMDQLIAQRCEGSKDMILPYSIASAITMVLYFLLLTDVAVFSTRVSAFALVIGRVFSELGLFVLGVLFTAFTFAAAISSLEQYDSDFAGLPASMLSLLKITFGMFHTEGFDRLGEHPVVLVAVFFYVLCTAIFFVNLLVAQLSCVYQAAYKDLLGYARLNRGRILVETMPRVSKKRWQSFVDSLALSEPIEFGEGDIGVAGGIQVFEPGNANPTTVDMIKRYGGSTSRLAAWPAESGGVDEEDRFLRLEKLIEQSNKRIAKLVKDSRKGGSGGGGGGSFMNSGASVGSGSSNNL